MTTDRAAQLGAAAGNVDFTLLVVGCFWFLVGAAAGLIRNVWARLISWGAFYVLMFAVYLVSLMILMGEALAEGIRMNPP